MDKSSWPCRNGRRDQLRGPGSNPESYYSLRYPDHGHSDMLPYHPARPIFPVPEDLECFHQENELARIPDTGWDHGDDGVVWLADTENLPDKCSICRPDPLADKLCLLGSVIKQGIVVI